MVWRLVVSSTLCLPSSWQKPKVTMRSLIVLIAISVKPPPWLSPRFPWKGSDEMCMPQARDG
jgi:hypothetical protein